MPACIVIYSIGGAVENEGRHSTYELVGEGACEGLYMPGVHVHGPGDESSVGRIFEGTLLAFPAPAEPLPIVHRRRPRSSSPLNRPVSPDCRGR